MYFYQNLSGPTYSKHLPICVKEKIWI